MSVTFEMASRLSRYLVRRISTEELRYIGEGVELTRKLEKQIAVAMEVVWTEMFDVAMADSKQDRMMWRSAFIIFRAHAKMGSDSMQSDRI